MKIVIGLSVLIITTFVSAHKTAITQVTSLESDSPFTSIPSFPSFGLKESRGRIQRRRVISLFTKNTILFLRGGDKYIENNLNEKGEESDYSIDDVERNCIDNEIDENSTRNNNNTLGDDDDAQCGVTVLEEENSNSIPIENNGDEISDDSLSTSSTTSRENLESFVPFQYYTTIFNQNNDLFGKGNFYTTRERIKNLLFKWEDDDIKYNSQAENDDSDSSKDMKELKSLQSLIYERAREFLEEVDEFSDKALEKGKIGTIPHPKKVLHYIAPKIPVIRRSPEIMLRISSARIRVDISAAACALGVMGIVTEYYKCILEDLESKIDQKDNQSIQTNTALVFKTIVTDRRFEQLIECVQCGVDIEETMNEASNVIAETLLSVNSDEKDMSESSSLEEGIPYTGKEYKSLKDGISVVDAAKSIWSLSVFLSRHYIEQLGEKKCLHFIHALQKRSDHFLRSQFRHFQNGYTEQIYRNSRENFVHDIQLLLRDTVSIMWASDCITQVIGNHHSFLLDTCTLILNQDIKEIWDLRQNQYNKEANVDDIVERLAEAEDEDTDIQKKGDNEEPNKPIDISSKKMEVEEAFSQSSEHYFSNLLPKTRFLFDFLSSRDLVVALSALSKVNNLEENLSGGVYVKLLSKVSLWLDHDLDILSGGHNESFTETVTPEQVQLVDAASLLSFDKQAEEGEIEHSSNRNELDDILDKSNLTMSINDLVAMIYILGSTRDDSMSSLIQKFFQLFLSYIKSKEIEKLENVNLLQILRGSSYHVYLLSASSSGVAKTAINFFSNVISMIFDRFRIYEEENEMKSLTSEELTVFVSSLHFIYSRLTRPNHGGVIDEMICRNFFTRSMLHAVENKNTFTSNQLCQLASIFIDSHQKSEIIQEMHLDSFEALGKIVAKICIDFDYWQNTNIDNPKLDEYDPEPPVILSDLCLLFSGLTTLKLYPHDLCKILSKYIQQKKHDADFSDNDLVQCLFTCAKMRSANSLFRDSNIHQSSTLVNSILKYYRQELCQSSVSSSPTNFAMLIWALAIHGAKYSNAHIPYFSLDELQSHPQSFNIQMLVGLTYACERSISSQLLINILSNIMMDIPNLNVDEICDVAECAHTLKQHMNANIIDDCKSNSNDTFTVSQDICSQSIDDILSTIASQIKKKYMHFSMHEMRILLQCYKETHILNDFINEKINKGGYITKKSNKLEERHNLHQNQVKEESMTPPQGERNKKELPRHLNKIKLAFECGWVKEQTSKENSHMR